MKLELSKLAEFVRKSKDWSEETKRLFIAYLRESNLIIYEEGKQLIENDDRLTALIKKFEAKIVDSG